VAAVAHHVLGLLALCAAGCGNSSVKIPRAKPTVDLVRCTAALPPPAASEVAETSDSSRREGRYRMRVGGGVRGAVARNPTVSFDNVSSVGPLPVDDVRAGLRIKLGQLTGCYRTAGGVPSKAIVRYRYVIGGNGSITSATSTSAALAGPLDVCVRRVLRTLAYPAKGSPTTVSVPLVFDATGAFAAPRPEIVADKAEPWTPFAIGTLAGGAAATGAARVTEAAVRQRVGGLGDRDGEACTAKALGDLHVMTPLQEHVEVACDLARGDAEPWRLTTSAGYDVIDVERLQLRHGRETIKPGASDPSPLPAETYVVIARPDTPGGLLQLAIMWARDASGILLAVADGKPAPLFLGMANAASSSIDSDDEDTLRPALRIGHKETTGCVGRSSQKAATGNADEIETMLGKVAARCRQVRCSSTLVVAIDTDAVTSDLLMVAGAARRNGFDRVLYGGSELGCSLDVKKPPPDDDFDDPDLE